MSLGLIFCAGVCGVVLACSYFLILSMERKFLDGLERDADRVCLQSVVSPKANEFDPSQVNHRNPPPPDSKRAEEQRVSMRDRVNDALLCRPGLHERFNHTNNRPESKRPGPKDEI